MTLQLHDANVVYCVLTKRCDGYKLLSSDIHNVFRPTYIVVVKVYASAMHFA